MAMSPWALRLAIRAMRVGSARLTDRSQRPAPDDGTVALREIVVPTRHGDAPVTVYTPARGPESPAPPVHVNLHGGGYVFGHPEQDDTWCRYLAHHAGVVVLNVDYVLAPEHPFPAAAHQCLDVVRWVAGHGDEQGWDGARLGVGGQSAGGGLAAAVARQARDGGGPAIALQVLHYPPLDLVTDPGAKRAAGGRAMITPTMARLFNAAYTPTPELARDPLASPAWGPNGDGLAGIAPAVVVTPELDRLHDEGALYAARLRDAGALVEHLEVPGADHAYDLVGQGPEPTGTMYAALAAHVARALGTAG